MHPRGAEDAPFTGLFTADRPVVFAYHGYPRTIHELIYRRSRPARFHVHGYVEEGTTTTPFDMTVLNDLDRCHLVIDAIDRVPGLLPRYAHVKQAMRDLLVDHGEYIREHGDDMPLIRDWRWPF
jgi:xylulose-5-phosphate/fructose-6-phosphate phosphoketolase